MVSRVEETRAPKEPIMPTNETIPTTAASPTLAERAASAVQLVRQAFALLELSPRTLTSRQRRHGLKFRKGAEPCVRAVALLSDTHGVVVPGQATSEMVASLLRAEELRTVRLALVSALAAVDDAIYKEQGDAYATALTLYGMLKKVGHRHAEIRTNLEAVAEFFSYRSAAALAERAKKRKAAKEAAAETAGASVEGNAGG
jgi:hypothetical protein